MFLYIKQSKGGVCDIKSGIFPHFFKIFSAVPLDAVDDLQHLLLIRIRTVKIYIYLFLILDPYHPDITFHLLQYRRLPVDRRLP